VWSLAQRRCCDARFGQRDGFRVPAQRERRGGALLGRRRPQFAEPGDVGRGEVVTPNSA